MSRALAAAVVILSFAGGGARYASPEKAAAAFAAALRSDQARALSTVFGRDARHLFDTGDPVADRNLRSALLSRYEAHHELARNTDTSDVLIMGDDDWPFPIPVVNTGHGWRFDTDAGLDDIIDRRIDADEIDAIHSCLAIAEAEGEYYAVDRDGDGVLEYATKLRSTPGQRDGLYWPAAPGEAPSPLETWAEAASEEGYPAGSSTFHGYQYIVLSGQGRNAPGGAYSYVADGHQIGGFAILAYPATYPDTGVMTFMISHSGIIYQSDLGPSTADDARAIRSFDPGPGWTKVIEKNPALVAER